MRLVSKDGHVRYIHVSTAIGSFLGSDVGQAIAVDVTDQEERDRQLSVLEQWLRHNIRNEMTVIHGIAEGIEQGRIDDVQEWAGRIRTHAARLVAQANHEREVIALLSNPPEPATTDVTSAVEEVVEECIEAYPDADIALGRADPVTANAIPELSAAVAELVGNAVEHSDRETPTVRVEVVDDGERAVVRVADDGPGIPERERHNLLLDHEVTQLDHGTGLGLVFTYWVVKLSDGDVGFAENDPRGSIVTLSLESGADA
jgi:signal transduction histidine kinase